jgi:hypothetical protein
MEIVDQQHVVEQLSPYAADETLRDGVHIRRANRRFSGGLSGIRVAAG